MRLKLEATPEELVEKSDLLIERLSSVLRPANPELADSLEKALPAKEKELKYPVLREIQKREEKAYSQAVDNMLKEVDDYLSGIIKKSEDLEGAEQFVKSELGSDGELFKAGLYIGPRGGRWADPGHTIPWKEVSGKLSKLVTKTGGKVKPHKEDPELVVVKVPKSQVQKLADLKQKYHLPGEITVGGKYGMLPVEKSKLTAIASKKPAEAPIAPGPVGVAMDTPEHAEGGWKPHQSLEDANQWAKDQGIHTDYPNLPVANACNEALSMQHPMVLKHVQFIGTGKQLNKWAKQNPGELQTGKKEAKHKLDMGKKSPLGPSAAAVAHPYTAKPYTKSVIVIHDGYFTEKAAKKKPGGGGFSLSEDLRDIVIHECGHVEGFVMRHLKPEGSDKSMWEVWKGHAVKALQSGKVMKTVSQYGATNPHECWAEVSVMRRTGRDIAPWLQKAFDDMGIDSQDWNKLK